MNNPLVFAGNLFNLSQTIAAGIFDEATYAWEVLPRIKEFIIQLAAKLPDDFERAGENVWIGRGSTIETTALIKGPAIIGYDCEIRHAAYIRGSVIVGNEVVVGNSTEIKNAILFNGVKTPHFNYIGDSILGYKSHLGAGVILSNVKSAKDQVKLKGVNGESIDTGLEKFGALIGDCVEIGCNSVLNPGTIVGPDTNIYPLTMVRGIIPAGCIMKNDGSIVQKVSSFSQFVAGQTN
jgi:NDP-sugar pyrophosphorylase family protein